MKKHLFYQLVGLLCYLMLSAPFVNLQAQTVEDICNEAGYELSTSYEAPSCPDASDATAIVASTGCNCLFSGCTFLWEDGQTFHTAYNLSAGSYRVTVTHPNGCVLDTTVTVHGMNNFVEGIDVLATSCNGSTDGTLSVNAVADAGQLTYLWSTGDSTQTVAGLPAGFYTVTVTNFLGCETELSASVTNGNGLAVQADVEDNCGNMGNIMVSVQGGQPPYTYYLNGTEMESSEMENLTSGTYQIGVSDVTGCSGSDIVVISELSTSAYINDVSTVVCPGEAIQLSAGGGLSYNWFPAEAFSDPTSATPTVKPIENTTYSVEIVDDNNCTLILSTEVAVKDSPTASISTADAVICPGESTQLIGITANGATAFNWQPTLGITSPMSNVTIAAPTQTTTYTLTATNNNSDDCAAIAQITIYVDEDCDGVVSGIDDNNNTNVEDMRLYPNPIGQNQEALLQFTADEVLSAQVVVYTSTGQTIQYYDLPMAQQHQLSIATNNLPAGVYFVQILTGDKQFTKRLLVY